MRLRDLLRRRGASPAEPGSGTATTTGAAAPWAQAPAGDRPLALVYRGPASEPAGCAEAVAELLESSRYGFDVRHVGPREALPLTADTLAAAAVYAQPGGGTLRAGWRAMRRDRDAVRDYVGGGGRYLGFCLGGYLAGATPGFGLLPGDTDRWIDSDGASVTHDGDAVVRVDWQGRERELFFQDGPRFLLDDGAARVLARYSNRAVAAAVMPFGAGRVGVVGPHPEAGPEWFSDAGLPRTDARDLGHRLIDEVMA